MNHRGLSHYLVLMALMSVQALPVAFAQSVTVETSIDQYLIGVGEPIRYVISVRYPEGADIVPIIDSSLDDFEILDSGTSSQIDHNEVIFKRWYKITSFEYGEHVLPNPVVSFDDESGVLQKVSGSSIAFTVQRLLPDDWQSEDIRGVKPLVPIGNRWWLWVVALLVGLICGLLFWMRKGKDPTVKNIEPPRPAHELALEALENLRRDDLLSQGKVEDYYVRISDIVRTYVEARFALRAPDMTSEEFLAATAQSRSISETHRTLLQEFLHHCDLVKFARYQPSSQEAGQTMASARRFVEETVIQIHDEVVQQAPIK